MEDLTLTFGPTLFPPQGSRSLRPSRSQSVDSIYLEAQLPIVSRRNSVPGVERLDVQLAVRRDKYSVEGATSSIDLANPTPIVRLENEESSVDPTIGVRYQPVSDLTIRTSYATGYRPPTVSQIVPSNTPVSADASSLTDPLRGNERLGLVEVLGGGNSNIRPESSESWSAGIIVTPRWFPNLRVSADWNQIEKTDNIGRLRLLSQSGLAEAISYFPDRVIRASPSDGFDVGPIVRLDETTINIAKLSVESIDLALDYDMQLDRLGMIGFSADATHMISIHTQASPVAPTVENVGVPAVLDAVTGGLCWRANAVLDWEYNGLRLGWRTRFFDSYFLNVFHSVNSNQGSAKVPSQIYHDLFGSYAFGSMTSGFNFLKDVQINFGINNVLDKEPPIDMTFINSGRYYSHFGDPRLANYYVSIRKNFGL